MSGTSMSAAMSERTHDKVIVAVAATLILVVGGVFGTFVLSLTALRALLSLCRLRPRADEALNW
jgi:hypothetical protein